MEKSEGSKPKVIKSEEALIKVRKEVIKILVDSHCFNLSPIPRYKENP